MPTDTQSILDSAEKIGQMVKDHPAFEKYRAAAKAVGEDPEAAGQLAKDFEKDMTRSVELKLPKDKNQRVSIIQGVLPRPAG